MTNQEEEVYVGIDLGTTYSSVMEYIPSDRKFLPFTTADGQTSIPSIVRITEKVCHVGKNAIEADSEINNVIHEVKRLMGKNYDEKDDKLMGIINEMPKGSVISMTSKRVGVKIDIERKDKVEKSVTFLPEHISAFVLRKLKESVERKKGKNCKIKAVVGVPAVFTHDARRATATAMQLAGIEMIKMVNEPTAAANAYHMEKDGKLLVFDFGGGTLDIAILQVKGNNKEVLHTNGDSFLGGKNIDYNIARFVKEEVLRIAKDENEMKEDELKQLQEKLERRERLIIEFSETLKKELSFDYRTNYKQRNASVTLEAEFLGEEYLDDYGTYPEITLTYEKFLEINASIFAKCRDLITKTLQEYNIEANQIDNVLMVGGSCHCPEIPTILTYIFGEQKVSQKETDFDTVVCKGLAMFAKQERTGIQGSTGSVKEISTKTISIEVMGRDGKLTLAPIIEKNTLLPISNVEKRYRILEDWYTTVQFNIFEDDKKKDTFIFPELPMMKAGQVTVVLKCDMFANGTFSISGSIEGYDSKEVKFNCESEVKHMNQDEIDRNVQFIEEIFLHGYKF